MLLLNTNAASLTGIRSLIISRGTERQLSNLFHLRMVDIPLCRTLRFSQEISYRLLITRLMRQSPRITTRSTSILISRRMHRFLVPLPTACGPQRRPENSSRHLRLRITRNVSPCSKSASLIWFFPIPVSKRSWRTPAWSTARRSLRSKRLIWKREAKSSKALPRLTSPLPPTFLPAKAHRNKVHPI